MTNISDIINKQNNFFKKGITKDINYRINSLKKLYQAIIDNEDKILQALKNDLHKSSYEAYMTEVGFTLNEISYLLKHTKKWTKRKRVKTSITNFPASSYIYPEPYGITLIMSPWNYPFQLTIVPLAASIAAGNCCIVKPSNYAKYTSKVMKEIINDTFSEEYIAVVEGGREANTNLLQEKFDYIFFTGSVAVGKVVMEAAAKHLTPVTLELGGKSPCIVDESANIELAAKRIVWGKFINAGQTCVAPDYLLVNENIKDELINRLKKYIDQFYGGDNFLDTYPKIINEHHFKRLKELLKNEQVIYGGKSKGEYIFPTLVDNVSLSSPLMKEEIFGPILPIIAYQKIDDVIKIVSNFPKPLALYLFTTSPKIEAAIINNVSFGGGCINDPLVHLNSSTLPFGGVGESGMGSYHGKASFDTFTHYKSIMKRKNNFDMRLKYPPYHDNLKVIKRILK